MNEHAYTDTLTHTKGPAWGASSINEYGEPNGATASITARVDPSTRRVILNNGEEHQAAFEVQTGSEVRVGDLLNISGQDHTVAVASPAKLPWGTVDHWEVVC